MYVLNLEPPTLSYVCMYVCMYVCTCVCVCVCVCVCMYVCMYVNVSLSVHLCIYIYRLATVSKEGRMTHPFLNRHLTKGACGWGPQKSCSEASEFFSKSSPVYKEAT